ncbi:hypothetical protein C2E23DRAFT_840890 [Lenzites betulinus]|nr:hypothetical protein C2E23DRAFT_840890 [Lenzites betulinus]
MGSFISRWRSTTAKHMSRRASLPSLEPIPPLAAVVKGRGVRNFFHTFQRPSLCELEASAPS